VLASPSSTKPTLPPLRAAKRCAKASKRAAPPACVTFSADRHARRCGPRRWQRAEWGAGRRFVAAVHFREIAELATAQRVPFDEIDVEQLKYDTDGWAAAVSWVVRDAARDGRGLRGAFEQWRQLNGHLLLELLVLSHDDAAASEAFVAAMRSFPDPATQRDLERLDAVGYPIVRMRSGLRPYRVLMQIAGNMRSTDRAEIHGGRLVLKLFGAFRAKLVAVR